MLLTSLTAVLAVLLAGAQIPDTAHDLPRGVLIENVASQDHPGQRFTVYLPNAYTPSRPAPILYVMDPRGRARLAAKLFQPAAERYGYILVSSHNTESDGPPELNFLALRAMWEAAHDRFSIDPRRVYVAGFSGTARTASFAARNLPGTITGIIGSAAAFHPDVRPARDERFLYFGTVGHVDYNFHEMEALERALVELDVPHRIERFDGGHSWMPPDLALRAVEWLELRAMAAGTRPADPQSLDGWWTREERLARKAIAAGRDLDAARRFAGLARDFAGLRDVSGIRAEAARLAGSAAALAESKRRQEAAGRSAERLRGFMDAIGRAFTIGAEAPARTATELAGQLELDRLMRVSEGSGEDAREGRRLLNELEVQLGFYLPAEALQAGEPRRAAYYLSVAVRIDDRSPVSSYLLARTSAQLGARKEALAALRHAYEAGFRDARLIDADRTFDALRTDAEFQAVVAAIRASGDVLDRLGVDRPPAHLISAR